MRSPSSVRTSLTFDLPLEWCKKPQLGVVDQRRASSRRTNTTRPVKLDDNIALSPIEIVRIVGSGEVAAASKIGFLASQCNEPYVSLCLQTGRVHGGEDAEHLHDTDQIVAGRRAPRSVFGNISSDRLVLVEKRGLIMVSVQYDGWPSTDAGSDADDVERPINMDLLQAVDLKQCLDMPRSVDLVTGWPNRLTQSQPRLH